MITSLANNALEPTVNVGGPRLAAARRSVAGRLNSAVRLLMTRSARARRSGLLCCHFLRNLAFYRSWDKAGQPFRSKPFWRNANSNFLDIAVLEWCKLFVDAKGKHHYSKALNEPLQFKRDLLAKLEIDEAAFDEYVLSFKTYRDQFLAHLDEENMMNIPHMKVSRQSAKFLYQRLLDQEAASTAFANAPLSAKKFYEDFIEEGLKVYGA